MTAAAQIAYIAAAATYETATDDNWATASVALSAATEALFAWARQQVAKHPKARRISTAATLDVVFANAWKPAIRADLIAMCLRLPA